MLTPVYHKLCMHILLTVAYVSEGVSYSYDILGS